MPRRWTQRDWGLHSWWGGHQWATEAGADCAGQDAQYKYLKSRYAHRYWRNVENWRILAKIGENWGGGGAGQGGRTNRGNHRQLQPPAQEHRDSVRGGERVTGANGPSTCSAAVRRPRLQGGLTTTTDPHLPEGTHVQGDRKGSETSADAGDARAPKGRLHCAPGGVLQPDAGDYVQAPEHARVPEQQHGPHGGPLPTACGAGRHPDGTVATSREIQLGRSGRWQGGWAPLRTRSQGRDRTDHPGQTPVHPTGPSLPRLHAHRHRRRRGAGELHG